MSGVTRLPGLGGDPPEAPVLGLRKVAENSDEMAAIGNILKALEGMQEQLMELTDLVVAMDHRIDKLEAKGKPKLITSRN
jgi:hypothetical protein